MPQRQQTYDAFVIHTIMPASGWQGIFYDDTIAGHFLLPVHALALVSRLTYEVGTQKLCHGNAQAHPDTAREIVGVNYALSDGWSVMDESRNFCGLLPPGKDLQDHVAERGCWHVIEKNGVRTQEERKDILTS